MNSLTDILWNAQCQYVPYRDYTTPGSTTNGTGLHATAYSNDTRAKVWKKFRTKPFMRGKEM